MKNIIDICAKLIHNSEIGKKAAFTLSEVLIALGIIGVIAILTVPNVSLHYRQKSWNAADQMFSERLSHAIYEMAQTGKMEGYTTTTAFVNVLNNSMPLMQICDSDNLTECFTESFVSGDDIIDTSELTTSQELGMENYNTEVIGFRTKFGVNGILAYNSNCATSASEKIEGIPCISYVIDTNNNTAPNTVGKDIRTLNVNFVKEEQIAGIGIPCENDNAADFYQWSGCKQSTLIVAEQDTILTPGVGTNAEGWGMNWETAMNACAEQGMRLPTVMELRVAYKASRNGVVTGFTAADYWTETTYSKDQNIAQNVFMGAGNWGLAPKNSTARRVRCVKN